MSRIDILLAAYNGERFIAEQIESLLRQSCKDWTLTIRDDRSNDRTLDISRSYADKKPGRIFILKDELGRLGVVRNYGQLLLNSSRPYIMFCDQDDVWFPDKIETQLDEIRSLEAIHGGQFPLAVFSDAKVVDESLKPISDSLLRYINRQRVREVELNRLSVEGNCYGCTMIINRALANRILEFTSETISHDWWCGLTAAVFGKLIYMDRPTLFHRRHSLNQSATQENSWARYSRSLLLLPKHRRWLQSVFIQAESFWHVYREEMNEQQLRLFRDLARVRQSNWFVRRWLLMKHGVRVTGAGRNIAFFLAV